MRKTLKVVAFGGGPADAFIKAAGITDSTQQTAIKTLVNDLNGYGLWSKMKAIYPMVGGTATAHSYNLKDPRDLDAAFRLVFSGGGTHSANGYQTNGVNAFAETYYNPSINLTDINSNHISIYSRTNNQGGYDIGGGTGSIIVDIEINSGNPSYNWNMASYFSHNNSNSQGHYINTRTASNAFKLIKNGSTVLGSATGTAGATKPNITYHISKLAGVGVPFANRQYAFATIGEGLSDTEAANLYTSIQKFQTTLNRFVGTPIYPSFDSDAQSFMTSASITDSTQQSAVNYLVTDLKSANLWSKMKAIYPMVGGTASSHSYNLKNPAQFQITWNGGITHDSDGVKGNGTNGYGNLNLKSNDLTSQSSFGTYCRINNVSVNSAFEFGATELNGFEHKLNPHNFGSIQYIHYRGFGNEISASNSSTNAFFHIGLDPSNNLFAYKNTSLLQSKTPSTIGTAPSINIYLLGYNSNGTASNFSARSSALFFAANGITQAENTTLYNIIQNYQTILNRQV